MFFTARTTRSLAVTAASVAVLAAAFHSTNASAATSVPRCRTPHLGVTLSDRQTFAGNTGWTITVQNDGQHSCRIRDYPLLGIENGKGKTLDSVTTDGPTMFAADPGRAIITLTPGGTATASLQYGSDGQSHIERVHILTVETVGAWWRTPVTFGRVQKMYKGELTVTAWKG